MTPPIPNPDRDHWTAPMWQAAVTQAIAADDMGQVKAVLAEVPAELRARVREHAESEWRRQKYLRQTEASIKAYREANKRTAGKAGNRR